MQLYFGIVQHLYNRIWILFIRNSDAGLFLTGCQIPLHLCCSVSESGVVKYANSLPLEECAFICKRFKNLETKSFVSQRTALTVNPTSYYLPPQFTNLSVPGVAPVNILRMRQEKVKMFIIQSMDIVIVTFYNHSSLKLTRASV